jgi:hypothetical protein
LISLTLWIHWQSIFFKNKLFYVKRR